MNKKLLLLLLSLPCFVHAQTTDEIPIGVYTSGNKVYYQYPSAYYGDSIYVNIFQIEEESDDVPGTCGRVALNFLEEFDYWRTFSAAYMEGNPYMVSSFIYAEPAYFTSGKKYRLAYRLTSSFKCRVYGHNPSYGQMKVKFSGGRDHNPPQVVINETINLSLDPASSDGNWIQVGTDSPYSEIHYTDWVEFSTTDNFYYYLISLTF